MDPERLIQKLEGFGRWSFVGFGAALTLLLMVILQMHVMHKSQVIEWYIAWGLLELLVTPTGLFLLFAKPWRQLPMRDRLDVARLREQIEGRGVPQRVAGEPGHVAGQGRRVARHVGEPRAGSPPPRQPLERGAQWRFPGRVLGARAVAAPAEHAVVAAPGRSLDDPDGSEWASG